MRRIREKLNSQSGASILMALLFFLVCAMVGASVLMASASNAGKSRSNRQEQQKYLTLSSAMQLVCKELTGARYKPDLEYKKETIYQYDDKGTITGVDHYKHIYTQKAGKYEPYDLDNVLPLLSELEYLFKVDAKAEVDQMRQKEKEKDGKDEYVFDSSISDTTLKVHPLTLTVDADQFADDDQVEMTVELREKSIERYRIFLSAELKKHPEYKMYAVLTLTGNAPTVAAATTAGYEVIWELTEITREEPK